MVSAKLDALALLDYAAHQEGELGGEAWWDCADAAMRALPELLAVVRAATAGAEHLTCDDPRPGHHPCDVLSALCAATNNLEAKL